jgi:hypothetical protein
MASSPTKRRRLEGADDRDELPVASLRERALADRPEYAAPAAAAVTIVVGTGGDGGAGSNGAAAAWHPAFTHQQFPGEKVWGYAVPVGVAITYSDPDMRVHVRATAGGTAPATGLADAGGREPLPPPDDLAEALRTSLPDGYPREALAVRVVAPAAAAAAAVGGAASSPLAPAPSDADFHPPRTALADEFTGAGGAWVPPGPAIARYTLGSGSQSQSFVLHRWQLGDSAAARAYHDRLSTLAMWLIETASPVDTDDEAWTVYGLYEEEEAAAAVGAPQPRLRLAGYATTYAFVTPFRKPRPASVRLAQLVLLPRYQRRGHGLRFMDAICADAGAGSSSGGSGGAADGTPAATPLALPPATWAAWDGPWLGGDAHEVTVEAPCEGMARLRDAHDVARALHVAPGLVPGWPAGYTWRATAATSDSAASSGSGAATAAPQPLPVRDYTSKELEPLRRALRCTSGQAWRVVEALTLASLGPAALAAASNAAAPAVAATGASSDDPLKPFRLAVKRRILATDADIAAVADVDTRKALLEDAYQAAVAAYLPALAAARLVPRALADAATAGFAAREARREVELAAEAAAAEEAAAAGEQ